MRDAAPVRVLAYHRRRRYYFCDLYPFLYDLHQLHAPGTTPAYSYLLPLPDS